MSEQPQGDIPTEKYRDAAIQPSFHRIARSNRAGMSEIARGSEQPWQIKDGKNGGVVICIGSKQIWFSGSSLESLERVMKAHDRQILDENTMTESLITAEQEKVKTLVDALEAIANSDDCTVGVLQIANDVLAKVKEAKCV